MRIENSGGKKVFNSSISPRGGKKVSYFTRDSSIL